MSRPRAAPNRRASCTSSRKTVTFKFDRTFSLVITGDSMMDRGIVTGDIGMFVLRKPRPGQVVAARIDGGRTLKTFMVKNGKPYLKAANPKYPDLHPKQELVILGVMVGLMRRIPSAQA